MAVEKHFEEVVLAWVIAKLGYVKQPTSNVSPTTWLLEAELIQFIRTTQANSWNEVVKKHYAGDHDAFGRDFCDEAHKYLYAEYNVFIRIGRSFITTARDRFRIHDTQFQLYVPSYTEKDGSEKDHNRYSVVQQLSLTFTDGIQKVVKRPDLVFFLNGVPFSLVQLKFQSSGQLALREGVAQLCRDYLHAAKLDSPEDTGIQPSSFYKSMGHVLAMDETAVYSSRTFLHKYAEIKQYYARSLLHDADTIESLSATFAEERTMYLGEYEQFKNEVEGRWQSVLYRMLRPEALVAEFEYNRPSVIQSHTVEKGKEVSKASGSNRAMPRVPRHVQTFGIEKTMQAVCNAYATEHVPNHELTRLDLALKGVGVSDDQRKIILDERKKYRNGIDTFSYLLQYAPGAGKTDIISLLASRLRMVKEREVLPAECVSDQNSHLFDKMILCTDRIDLKNQLYRNFRTFNIPSSMVHRVDNKEELIKALHCKTAAIIVINIQKFKRAAEWATALSANVKRCAFLIDEVHRSNTGEHHEAMMSVFEDLTMAMSKNEKHKNLIVGFTATPTVATLQKFGQFTLYPGGYGWEPLDSYTFNDAVKDGYILNPLDGLYSLGTSFHFDEAEEGITRNMTKTEMYEHSERIKALSIQMAQYMVSTTFNQIRKSGRAMVVAHSVKAAIQYYTELTAALAALGSTKPVFILYSSKEGCPESHTLCGQPSEADVILAYQKQGGVIVVVDKLQTGFDEPNLHTLFLDKEVSGVNAVQTACRVNRTTAYKDSCVVIDCTIGNVNMSTIPAAFAQYGGYVSTDSSISPQIDKVKSLYKRIKEFAKFKDTLRDYRKAKTEAEKVRIQTMVATYIADCKEEAEQHRKALSLLDENDYEAYWKEHDNVLATLLRLRTGLTQYVALVNTVNAISPLDREAPHLVDDTFLAFIRVWLNVLSLHSFAEKEDLDAVDAQLVACGWTEAPKTPEAAKPTKGSGNQRQELAAKGLASLGAMQNHGDKNWAEEARTACIEQYKLRLGFIFTCLVDNNVNTMAHIDGFIHDAQKLDYDSSAETESTRKKFKDALGKLGNKLRNLNNMQSLPGALATIKEVPDYDTLPKLIERLLHETMVSHAFADFHYHLNK